MPRKKTVDDVKPRRRRAAAAVAIEPEEERGLMLRVLLHSPKDTLAVVAASAAVVAIVTNAMFLQAGRHPSPIFGAVSALPSPATVPAPASIPTPLPRVRPAEAEQHAGDKPDDVAPVAAKANAASIAPRPPAAIPAAHNDPVGDLIVSTRRIAAVQRALTEYGYGQLKPTGVIGADTQAAIQKFERDRKLPQTGQLSDRLIHDLTVLTGHPID